MKMFVETLRCCIFYLSICVVCRSHKNLTHCNLLLTVNSLNLSTIFTDTEILKLTNILRVCKWVSKLYIHMTRTKQSKQKGWKLKSDKILIEFQELYWHIFLHLKNLKVNPRNRSFIILSQFANRIGQISQSENHKMPSKAACRISIPWKKYLLV